MKVTTIAHQVTLQQQQQQTSTRCAINEQRNELDFRQKKNNITRTFFLCVCVCVALVPVHLLFILTSEFFSTFHRINKKIAVFWFMKATNLFWRMI